MYYWPFTRIVRRQSNSGCILLCPVVMILWKTTIRRSACVPLNTGISIGIVAVYGLLRRTPKFLSPLSNNKMNTPICMRPIRANKRQKKTYNCLNITKSYKRVYWVLHWSALESFKWYKIGTKTSRTSQLFNTKYKNFCRIETNIDWILAFLVFPQIVRLTKRTFK